MHHIHRCKHRILDPCLYQDKAKELSLQSEICSNIVCKTIYVNSLFNDCFWTFLSIMSQMQFACKMSNYLQTLAN